MSLLSIHPFSYTAGDTGEQPRRLCLVSDRRSVAVNKTESGHLRLDTVNECLWRRRESEDERILLTPKAFAVLRYLIENAGRLVTQDELLDELWPDTFVQPEVLKYQIADVRDALGDRPRNPLFIETLPRRGYRFIATVDSDGASLVASRRLAERNLVGRERELCVLHQSLRQALEGHCQIVFITGETGIGKTALIDEFLLQAAARDPAIQIARGQCVEGYGGAEPYYPILEALGELCHRSEGNRVIEILAEHAPNCLVQFPALRGEQCAIQRDEIFGSSGPRMLRGIRSVLDTLASKRPVLLAVEDTQWIDASTVDLISAMARQRTPARIMLILSERPADATVPERPLKRLKQDLLVRHLCREVTLPPFSEAEITEYLHTPSEGGALPDGFAALLLRYSEGNPSFLIEVLDHMTERGWVSHKNGDWLLHVPLEQIEMEVPENLRRIIESGIERLTAEEQRALEAASVLGTRFCALVVAHKMKMNPEAIESIFERLLRRGRLLSCAGCQRRACGGVSHVFEFRHRFYREVLYRRQTSARRAMLEREMTECLEDLPGQEALVPAGPTSDRAMRNGVLGDWS